MPRNTDAPVDVVFVGQLPPPRHGQSVTNLAMVRGNYRNIRVTPVTMRFSDDVAAVGRFQLAKVLQIPGLVWAVYRQWWASRRAVLFYTVGAKNLVGIARDLLVLPLIRPLFRRTVFFVHSGGMRPLYDRPGLRLAARLAYGRADLVIYLDPSVAGPEDGLPPAKQVAYLPHGVADPVASGVFTGAQLERGGRVGAPPVILFVGNLYPSKGTHHLVRAAGLVAARGHAFALRFVGAPPTARTEAELMQLAEEHGIADRITLTGALEHDGVWRELAGADIFCFPTHYEAEAWGTVVLEAMAAGLPVVATRWRALPVMVDEGVTGSLVDPDDDVTLADRLEALVTDPDRARAMGRAGRERFLERYSLERFEAGFERLVLEAAGDT